jgi:LacI family transcriptional regulator
MGKLRKPIQRRVTIKDIAAMANVSIGTVDRVLHHRGEVNQSTHERVMSFVEELGYTPNLLAKSLALKKGFSIMALIPDAGDSNPYWEKPLAGLNRATEELKDFNTKIAVYNFDPGEELSFINKFDSIMAMNPDGIILAPSFHKAAVQLLPKCKALNIPLILIDNNLGDGSGLAYFGQDALQSGTVAAKLMHYGLPLGAKVLIINLARNKAITRHMQQREQGFTSFFKEEVPDLCIKTESIEIDLNLEEEPAATLKKVLSDHPNMAGIFVTNSRVHNVARYLSETGKSNLLLIGYDLINANLEYIDNCTIDFLICQKPEDQGYKSAMAMFNYLLTGKHIEKVNYCPIDIIIKENVNYYKNIIKANRI